ncbi:MAG: HD domain-containing protein, partial [Christensenella sp.]|uniref:HD domain-containing protein n=1 Tax=Christensenella sp. TaxID=1935934 RepID=UPI002B1E996D
RCDNYGRGGAHVPQNVVFTTDINEDALRRDFTVNALYAGEDGNVLDPTKRGLAALCDKKIVQVCDDTLSEDALRILRMVRFSCQLGFTIEEETYACAQKYAHQLADISKERIRDEFTKILLSDAAYGVSGAVLKGLYLLKDLGAFRFIFPRLLEGDGVKQSATYHAYDVLEHSLRTCACTPPDLVTRLAGLLHDIGKPEALRRGGRMYGHERLGRAMSENAVAGLRYEKAVAAAVGELVENHMFDLNNTAGKKAVARLITRLGERQFLRLIDVREADFAGSGKGNPALSAQKWREILKELLDQNAPIDKKNLAISGNDLKNELGIPQGKRIGMLLSQLHEYAVKKPSQNNYKSLLRYAKIVNARDGAEDGRQ